MKKHKLRRNVKYALITVIAILFILFAILSFFIGSHQQPKAERDTSPEETEQKNYPTIIIDAGHGGEDGGAIGYGGVLEKDINLAVAKRLEQMFNSKGLKTRLTRTDDRLLYDPSSDYQGRKTSSYRRLW